jgi:Domain of unknown function (DUF1772)
LLAVALGVVPAFLALPPERYVEVHQLVGRHFDHVMPPTVIAATVTGLALAARTEIPVVRLLFAAAAVLHIGVSVVSQFGNVPINRRVKRLTPQDVPVNWDDPRRLWRAWHLLRTCLAGVALAMNACAAVLAH